MIITLKDKDFVWVGVSTDNTYSLIHRDDIINEENLKMWRTSGAIMASYKADGIDIDRIRYQARLDIPGKLDHKSLIRRVIPNLTTVFEDTDMMDGDDSWQSFVIAKGDKAFEICSNFVCTEIEDFEVTGSRRCSDVAWGSMTYNKSLPPIERIAEAFRDVERIEYEVQFPIVIMNTKSKQRVVIYE